MEIKTKFSIGDEVYFIDENRLFRKPVIAINIKIREKNTFRLFEEKEITYSLGTNKGYVVLTEDKIFNTKEEIIKSIEGLND